MPDRWRGHVQLPAKELPRAMVNGYTHQLKLEAKWRRKGYVVRWR
jgi:hypothetical protein